MTKREFLEKARSVHGYKYNYIDLSDKIISNDIIKIELNGVIYTQRVVKHINMSRCPEKNTPRKTTDQFISEAKEVWGDKYDYSLTEYNGALKNVKIIYDGVVFEQIAGSHIGGMAVESNMNFDSFIKKSKEKWGNKYDYSLVEFISTNEKVKIIHNGIIYEQSPRNHLISSPEKIVRLKSSEDFITQCSIIHNNKYDYSKTKYISAKDKVIIICPVHGDFNQCANTHFMGGGCIECGYLTEREYKNRSNTEEFIIESKKVWGDKYDYSLAVYINAKTKIKIIYDGIIYEQLPGGHLKYPVEGYLDKDIFSQRSKNKWGDKYDYSLVNYIDCKDKVKIIYDGVIYEQTPHNHLTYAPEKILRKTEGEFIIESVKFHGDKYSYDKVTYINDKNKVIIICPEHGEFKQTPSVHLRSGCPHCGESKGEKEINNFLKKYNITFERQYTFSECKHINPLKFDFYIPSLRMCIEFDGQQHFEPIEYFGGIRAFELSKIRDKIKNDYCDENYINLIRIKYDQYDNIYKILWDNLKTYLKNIV